MVGWIQFKPRRRVEVRQERVLGLYLCLVELPEPRRKTEKAYRRKAVKGAKLLRQAGCRRVLSGKDFPCWDVLTEYGLRPVSPELFLQAMAEPMALEWLQRRGILPEQATIALRGERVNRAFFQTAEQLCPVVRTLIVSAQNGGEELQAHLRREFGAAVPETGKAQLILSFSPGMAQTGEQELELFGKFPYLGGIRFGLEDAALPEELEPLPLLALLWEERLLSKEEIALLG